jgi:hypothetical protein
MITRRGFLAAASTGALAGVSVSACSSAPVVNDISQLEATAVAGVIPVQRQADIVLSAPLDPRANSAYLVFAEGIHRFMPMKGWV